MNKLQLHAYFKTLDKEISRLYPALQKRVKVENFPFLENQLEKSHETWVSLVQMYHSRPVKNSFNTLQSLLPVASYIVSQIRDYEKIMDGLQKHLEENLIKKEDEKDNKKSKK